MTPSKPIPYTHPTDCPAWVFDAALALPLDVCRSAAAEAATSPTASRKVDEIAKHHPFPMES